MREQTWIVDPATGDLVAEGLTAEEVSALADDLLPTGHDLNCARPLVSLPLPDSTPSSGPILRVARLYHSSVVDGPGRRSVCQVQGCTLGCPQCGLSSTHPTDGGVLLSVETVAGLLLDPASQPRDGITITGGEPTLQPNGLLALLQRLKAHGVHIVVYSGYTLEALAQRPEPEIHACLRLIDLLIDGPFVARLADDAGEWRGSRNQRVIPKPGEWLEQSEAVEID